MLEGGARDRKQAGAGSSAHAGESGRVQLKRPTRRRVGRRGVACLAA